MTSFGTTFRKARQDAGLTLGDAARAMGLSVSAVSDFEHSRRPPPSQDRLARLEALLGAHTVKDLSAAAARMRTSFQLKGVSPVAVQVGAALERRWAQYSDDDLMSIQNVLNQIAAKWREAE